MKKEYFNYMINFVLLGAFVLGAYNQEYSILKTISLIFVWFLISITFLFLVLTDKHKQEMAEKNIANGKTSSREIPILLSIFTQSLWVAALLYYGYIFTAIFSLAQFFIINNLLISIDEKMKKILQAKAQQKEVEIIHNF